MTYSEVKRELQSAAEGNLEEILVDATLAVQFAKEQIEESLGAEAATEFVTKKLPSMVLKNKTKKEGWREL